jgi:hypothetical protein
MRSHLYALLLGATLVAGCTEPSTDDRSQRNDVSGEEECDCTIDGEAVGRVGAAVKPPGHTTIRVASWISDASAPDRYTGFTLWGDFEGATYVVHAGGATYAVTGGSFSLPSNGATAQGITGVDFCPDDPPPPTDDGPPVL